LKGDKGLKASTNNAQRLEGSKAHLKEIRLESALKMMIKCSKAHMKEGGKTQRFFRWPNSHGRPAQVEKFSKMKNFQKQFQSLAISSWPSA
jgi:hypothetical protein